MVEIVTPIFYVTLFIFTFVQVFMLVTIFEKKEFKNLDEEELRKKFEEKNNLEKPTVTIIVPIFNEETTVIKTMESLLGLNYPKDKLLITVVDDGSTDNSWDVVQIYKNHLQIHLYKKENGGKYTAVNYGIEMSTSDFIGCLDADSSVDSEALNYMFPYFDDKDTMVVTPSLCIENSDTVIRMMQNAEYKLRTFCTKVLNLLDAQYITPGPFSIFRKSVFTDLGKFRHAHNTEDLEIALRLQLHHHKIAVAEKAIIYTVGPRDVYKLYKQRVRWSSGFIYNMVEYKKLIFNPAYSNLGMFVLPLALFSMVFTILGVTYSLIQTTIQIISAYKTAQLTAWDYQFDFFSIDWWQYNFQTTTIIGIMVMFVLGFSIWYGHITTKVVENDPDKKRHLGVWMDAVYFVLLYSLISPFWVFKSVYNGITKRESSWR